LPALGLQPSIAIGVVWSNALEVINTHDRGALIRLKSGLWLAIPNEAAGNAPSIFGPFDSQQAVCEIGGYLWNLACFGFGQHLQ